MTTPSQARGPRAVARALAALYRDRDRAKAFLEEALDDAWACRGWAGRASAVVHFAGDALRSRLRPHGLPITAAPITTTPTAFSSRGFRGFMDTLLQDMRFAARQWRRHPAFACAAVLTMALGIGANTAIFSVAWQTLLRPLPYPQSEQLVEIWETFGSDARTNYSMPAKFYDLQTQAQSYQRLAAYNGVTQATDLLGAGEPRQVRVNRVTEEFFPLFGAAPLLGRTLDASDFVARDATVISERLWRSTFGASPTVLGRTLTLGGSPAVIVGVMPLAFDARAGRVDAWTPALMPPATPRVAAHYLRVVGRLKPGVTIAAADAEAKAIAKRAAAIDPQFEGTLSATVASLVDGRGTERADPAVRSSLRMLTLAAGVVLLICCANLASLQMVRTVARGRELGIRTALGAGRGRLLRQLLTESLMIAALGGAAGIALGWWSLRALVRVAPTYVTETAAPGLSPVVIAYGLGLAAIAAILFALAPSLRAASRSAGWLRTRTESGDRRASSVRTLLVAAQVAASVMLLVGATVLIGSLVKVLRVDPGFETTHGVAFDLSLSKDAYREFVGQRALVDRLDQALYVVNGVRGTCFTNAVPLEAQGGMTFVPEGRTQRDAVPAMPQTITAGCLDVLGVALRAGRGLTDHESTNAVVVSEGFARAAWPGQSALGQRVHLGVATGALFDVVGVARDVLATSLEGRPYPRVYLAWTADNFFTPSAVVVRTSTPPGPLLGPIKDAVRRVDGDQPVARLRTLSDVIGVSTASRRFTLALIGGFAMIALVLAAVGMYGLLSQVLAQRTAELSVRLALGATPWSVVRLMLKSAVVALIVGVPVGLGGAAAAAGLLRTFAFRVSATDPALYALACGTIVAVVLAAAWLPARRASRIDPVSTLR